MDDSEKLGLLSAGLGDLLHSGLFSDLKVVCSDGSTHKVHKNILCAQSQFFRNALNPQSNFLEAKTNVMKLEHDDPTAVKALLEYCYRCDYTNIEGDPSQLLVFHISIYTVGEKYFTQGLKRLAVSRIGDIFSSTKDLKKLDFSSTVKTIYKNTAASDDDLRSLIVNIANDNFDGLMSTKGFSETMDELEQFRRDLGSLMLKQRQKPSNGGQYCCYSCNADSYMELPANDSVVYCPHCKHMDPAPFWKRRQKKPLLSLPKYRCRSCLVIVSMQLRGMDLATSTNCIACGSSSTKRQWQAGALDEAKNSGSKR